MQEFEFRLTNCSWKLSLISNMEHARIWISSYKLLLESNFDPSFWLRIEIKELLAKQRKKQSCVTNFTPHLSVNSMSRCWISHIQLDIEVESNRLSITQDKWFTIDVICNCGWIGICFEKICYYTSAWVCTHEQDAVVIVTVYTKMLNIYHPIYLS